MKRLVISIICVFCLLVLNNISFAAQISQKITNMPEYAYLKFYDLTCDYYYNEDGESGFKYFGFYFKPNIETQVKSFSKDDKKLYKQCSKYTKKIQKNKYDYVLYRNSDYLPALSVAFLDNNNRGNYAASAIYLNQILRINDYINIFNYDEKEYLEFFLGITYRASEQYSKAIEIFSKINSKTYIPRRNNELAHCYWKLGNHNKAIQYADDVIKTKKINKIYKNTLDIKYAVLFESNRIAEANKVAYELYSYSFPDKYTASVRIAASSFDNNTKIKYYEMAKNYTQDNAVIAELNATIADIEQKIIDNSSKTITGFYVKPNWNDLTKNDLEIINYEIYNNRYDEYHKDIQNCLQYKGNDLKACYQNVINKQEKISQKLWDNYREYCRQIDEAERLRQLQMINNNISQQNYLIQQQNYELTRPKTYSTTIMPVGNMYYMNTTRY